MRLLFTREMPASVIDRAAERFDVEVKDGAAALTETGAAAAMSIYDAIVPTLGDAFTDGAFHRAGDAPRTRLLANFGAGTDHIAADAARTRGVAVTNTPGIVTDATADIALTLILMACRRAGEGERLVRMGNWTGWRPMQLLGTHVTGRTVGIVGMGRIGRAVAARCHNGFGMPVVFHNRSTVEDPGVPARQLPLREVLETADIVVIAVPATAETRGMIGADQLAALGPGGYLVNVARGDVVDETALIRALEQGQIAGAGLDVYAEEPTVPERLRRLDNAVLLPHLGTAAFETREAMGMMALDNVFAWADGADLPNLV